jgi:hypothetical protein
MASLYGPDSVHDFERAADQRYAEATFLAANGLHVGGAVYLFGYVAEMVLKSATFRFLKGGKATDPISEGERKAVEKMIKTDLKPHPNYNQLIQGPHNFLSWANWLVLVSGTRYSPQLGSDIISNAENVFNHWDPNMRYHELSVTPAGLAVVQTSTDWLRANYPQM